MALKISRGFAMVAIGQHETIAEVGTDFELVDGGTGADTITRTVGDFTAKFKAGDKLRVLGATDPNDDVQTSIVSVTALTITLNTNVWTTGQARGGKVALVVPKGGTVPDVFNGGSCVFYSGTRPTSANDDIGTSTVLMTVSNVQFGDFYWDDVNQRAYVESSIAGTVTAAGNVTWARLVAPGDNAGGASVTAKRIDASVGQSVGDILVSATAWSVSDPVSFVWRIRMPLSAV